MSEADKMFEELGYKKTEHIYHTLGFVVEYDNDERQIDFINEDKEVKIWNISTDMQELQAINEKVKELRLVRKLGDKNELYNRTNK